MVNKRHILQAAMGLLTMGYIGSGFAHVRHFHHHYHAHRVNTVAQTNTQPAVSTPVSASNSSLIHTLVSQTDNLGANVLQVGLTAYQNARARGLDSRKMLTIIDYSQPSTAKRMWVIDLARQRVLFNTLVAHGKNSGDNYATNFSNSPSSEESSLGVFLTGNTYSGKHGISMRLLGLERGFNSNAYARAIVMHSADYVSEGGIFSRGRIGRSWGCPALDPRVEPKIVNTIKDGTLIVAYYPSHDWLSHSQFLRPVSSFA